MKESSIYNLQSSIIIFQCTVFSVQRWVIFLFKIFLALFGFLIAFFALASSTNIAKAATTDGNFTIQVPNGGNLVEGCGYSADIRVNSGSNVTNAADIIVNFDPTKIEIIDSNLSQSSPTAKQIKTGPAYEVYPSNGNRVDEGAGIIRLSGVSLSSTFAGNDIFGTIQFRGKPGATNGALTIGFSGVGDTLDSNIADHTTSTDVLGSVTNAAFTFTTGSCIPDTVPPNIIFVNPVNNQRGVDVNQNINLSLTDNLSGVDINTLQIFVNGVEYTATSPQITITGNPNNYSILLNPTDPFYSNSPSSILVKVKDFAGNEKQSNISFNFPIQPTPTIPTPVPTTSPIQDLTKPVIQFVTPIANQTIDSNEDIIIDLTDSGSGINRDTIVIFVNDKRYTINDFAVTITGDPSNYRIVINDNFNFSKVSSSYLSVFANDFTGNSNSGNLVFNVPQNVVDENTPPDVCPAQNPGTCVTNAPFNEEINNIQENLNNITPENLQPVVQNTGFLGLASILALLPLLFQILITLGSFIAGGFLWPLLYALILPSSKKLGKIIDDYTKEGLPLTKIIIREKKTNSIVRKASTDLFGYYAVRLDPGEYIMHLEKKNYQEFDHEFTILESKDLDFTMQMTLLEKSDIGTNVQLRVFKFDPILFTSVLAVIIAALNLLYIRTIVAVLIFLIALIFVGFVFYRSVVLRKPLSLSSNT